MTAERPLFLQRAGANVAPLKAALRELIGRLPKVEARRRSQRVPGTGHLLNVTDKEAQKRGDQFIDRNCCFSHWRRQGEIGKLLRSHGVNRKPSSRRPAGAQRAG